MEKSYQYWTVYQINVQEPVVSGIVALILVIILFIQDSPFIYYAYAGFPIFFWEHVISNRETIWLGLQVLAQSDGKRIPPMTVATQTILYIGILESLVPAPHTPALTV